MYCRSRGLVQETNITKVYVADFLYENLDTKTITNYDVVKNHFTNFKIDREYDNFLTDQGNHSLSYLTFKLCKNADEEDWICLFSITIETDPIISPTYVYYFREDFNDSFPGSINDFLIKNPDLENFNITIEMETTFYLHLTNEPNYDEVESENEDYIEIIPVIEDVFKIEECSVCLTNTPNIINIPCLHLSICQECEEKGKFKKCVTCRKSINRKILI